MTKLITFVIKDPYFIETLFKELNINLMRIPVQSYYNMKDIEARIKEKI